MTLGHRNTGWNCQSWATRSGQNENEISSPAHRKCCTQTYFRSPEVCQSKAYCCLLSSNIFQNREEELQSLSIVYSFLFIILHFHICNLKDSTLSVPSYSTKSVDQWGKKADDFTSVLGEKAVPVCGTENLKNFCYYTIGNPLGVKC